MEERRSVVSVSLHEDKFDNLTRQQSAVMSDAGTPRANGQ